MTRYKSNVAVFLVLTRIHNGVKEVLLQRRQNTGYMDGFYDCGASGHLEENESLICAVAREAKEELGIIVKKEDLKFVTLFHNHKEGYVRCFFEASEFDGIPQIMEKEKCSELVWVPMNKLPDTVVSHLQMEFYNIANNITYDDNDNYDVV